MPWSAGVIDHRKKLAKQLLKAVRARDAKSTDRVRQAHPRFSPTEGDLPIEQFKLSHAQLTIAREFGFSTWPAMVAALKSDDDYPEIEHMTDWPD